MQKQWTLLEPAPASFYKEFPELQKIIADLLYQRHIRTQEKIDEFLSPDYSDHVHNPFLFKNMERAVLRIFSALEKKERIVIHGDYDADGVSASTILLSTLKALGGTELDVFLPHRETDGYGLNARTVQLMKEQNTKVIITCDCGISNTEEVNLAESLGMNVIITDHHSIPAVLPQAYAIIHPKVAGETYPDQGLAGGGVAFKLAQALLSLHKEKNSTLLNGETHESFEKWLLDMVAIASVADMVPLVGESRTLTKYGLVVLNKTKRLGLKKLFLEAKILEQDGTLKKEITAETIGFQIAPRINAAGRLDHANVALKLLVSEQGTEAVDLAFELEKNNTERKTKTDTFVKQAIEQVETQGQKNNHVLFVIGKDWTTGIVGLIASRLKEKYQKPTIALAYNGDTITGSGRSVTGFNMIESIQEMPEHFIKFGGHPMACGFSLANEEKLESFKQDLFKKYTEKTKNVDMSPKLLIDAQTEMKDINWELFDVLDKFKPFGQQNERPKYLIKNLSIVDFDTLGADKKHLKLLVRQNGGAIKKTIGWRMCDKENTGGIDWLTELKIGEKVDMVVEVDVNEWNGNRELQLTIVDLRKSLI